MNFNMVLDRQSPPQSVLQDYVLNLIQNHQETYGRPMPRRVVLSSVQTLEDTPFTPRYLYEDLSLALGQLSDSQKIIPTPDGLKINPS